MLLFAIIELLPTCHDQESNLGSRSNDSSTEVTNHYPEMTKCGRNLNYGFIPRPMNKSVSNLHEFINK